jgi:Protein of unknown function (DUF3179)
VWDRAVDGRILHFHLVGLNNQNFLMADEETGSWWQQVSGECILGPMKGKRLRRISSDEVSLATWRAEHADSTAVRFDPRYKYPGSDWETRLQREWKPQSGASGPIPPRELVVGVNLNGVAAAYPLAALRERSPLNAQVGGTPIAFIVGADGNSVRCFVRRAGAQVLEFYRRPEDGSVIDSPTGSAWNFAGRATAGPLAGQELEPVQVTKDFWFDWRNYHPETTLRRRGL